MNPFPRRATAILAAAATAAGLMFATAAPAHARPTPQKCMDYLASRDYIIGNQVRKGCSMLVGQYPNEAGCRKTVMAVGVSLAHAKAACGDSISRP